jgi:hypothetical protein
MGRCIQVFTSSFNPREIVIYAATCIASDVLIQGASSSNGSYSTTSSKIETTTFLGNWQHQTQNELQELQTKPT